jgi:hypothetical protein
MRGARGNMSIRRVESDVRRDVGCRLLGGEEQLRQENCVIQIFFLLLDS